MLPARSDRNTSSGRVRLAWACGWAVAITAAVAVRSWNALAGPLMWGYDAWGHVAYVLYLDLYRSVPWADQGWSYFHPPLHYLVGAILAQWRSSEVLVRGLALYGGAASLATAALAAWIAHRAAPAARLPALLAFTAVAMLPLHIFMSPMPGNEMTLTLVTAAAIAVFIANEMRERPSLGLDAVCGVLLGAALLTKFSGLIPVVVVAATLGLRTLFGDRRSQWGRSILRAAAIVGVALALAAPYYARNVETFGTPFQLSRDFPLIIQVERDQPPGKRAIADYFRFPLRVFSEPNPLAPHLLHSVWGTVYLNLWADIFRESDDERSLEAERSERPTTTAMAIAGLIPTGLAGWGAFLALADLRAGRRREIYLPLLLLAGATLAAFAIFAWRVPIWSALKASYLLSLSLPYGVFLARATERFGAFRSVWLRHAPAVAVAGVAAAAGVVGADGLVLPKRADAPATGAVRFYFEEYPEASRVYGRLVAGAGYKVPWLENLAAVKLAEGRPDRARKLYARAVEKGLPDPYRRGRLAVAMAASGDLTDALAELDRALAAHDLPEVRANRGAVHAARGDTAAAESDLLRALAENPEIVPAWRNLALLQQRAGRVDASRETWRRAQAAACAAPRGYPYGLGTGEVLQWGIGRRSLLLLTPDGVRVAEPAFYRTMCADFAARASSAETGEG